MQRKHTVLTSRHVTVPHRKRVVFDDMQISVTLSSP